jgi:hypothetical protein
VSISNAVARTFSGARRTSEAAEPAAVQLVALSFPTTPLAAARTLITLLLVRRALWLPMLIALPAIPALV